MNTLIVSGSPHVQSKQTTGGIMWSVVIALLPVFLTGIYFFGLSALWVTLVSVAACVAVEWVIQKYLLKGELTIVDGSAVITGMLLAFNLPANVPLWIVIIGAVIAIGVGKMSFGGLGKNPFNPALVGRVFLFLSFPTYVAMSQWITPQPLFETAISDALTGPTPLSIVKQGGETGPLDMFLDKTGGSLGEMSAVAILLGGIFLLFRKVITWHIPVAFIGSAAIFASILWLIDPNQYADPLIHILCGGMMLGAVFMATDMVTSPTTKLGQIIFGAGCGILTMLFRSFGPMPEGVSFAILIMNAVTPLINKGIKPTRFGHL